MTLYLLFNDPASNRMQLVKLFWSEAKAKASVKSAFILHVVDPKPSELSMTRMKHE